MQPFDPGATTRHELMESRSRQFIALDARAAKGHFAQPPLSREERELVAQFAALNSDLGRREVDNPVMDRPW